MSPSLPMRPRTLLALTLLGASQAAVAAGVSLGWAPALTIGASLVGAALAALAAAGGGRGDAAAAGLGASLRALAAGDLTQPITDDGAAAPEAQQALRQLQAELRKSIGAMRSGADGVALAANEIAQGNADLSMRTEHTASNLQRASASMAQFTGSVAQTAESARTASQLAASAAEVAERGGAVVGQVVATMDEINGASKRIADIIGVIDGIAFQTNILALNAAVEAARAGEQGRGFAVVAGEVRSLAQRSAGAAREIKALIGQSVEQVASGTEVVREAGATIERIVEAARRVSELLADVATGTREQTLGIGQVGQAVQELDRVTQHNAALVEQTAAASTAMREQAQALAHEVARFRLPAQGSAAAAAGPAHDLSGFDFADAIEAHRRWKVRLRQAIAGRERLDAADICRDDRCALGQWIHGPGGRRHGTRTLFTDLLARHAEFHRAAGEVARRINAGAYDDAQQLLDSGSEFARLSGEVSTLLATARREF